MLGALGVGNKDTVKVANELVQLKAAIACTAYVPTVGGVKLVPPVWKGGLAVLPYQL